MKKLLEAAARVSEILIKIDYEETYISLDLSNLVDARWERQYLDESDWELDIVELENKLHEDEDSLEKLKEQKELLIDELRIAAKSYCDQLDGSAATEE